MSLDKLICNRCGEKLNDKRWDSEWDPCHPEVHHYKSILCDCGKKNWLRMNFLGSGHDRIQEDPNPIESSVKKVQEGFKESFE